MKKKRKKWNYTQIVWMNWWINCTQFRNAQEIDTISIVSRMNSTLPEQYTIQQHLQTHFVGLHILGKVVDLAWCPSQSSYVDNVSIGVELFPAPFSKVSKTFSPKPINAKRYEKPSLISHIVEWQWLTFLSIFPFLWFLFGAHK